jgi:hypothetical protein
MAWNNWQQGQVNDITITAPHFSSPKRMCPKLWLWADRKQLNRLPSRAKLILASDRAVPLVSNPPVWNCQPQKTQLKLVEWHLKAATRQQQE